MEQLNLDELEGYTEDREAQDRFVKPYCRPCMLGFMISLVGFVLLFPLGFNWLSFSIIGFGLLVYLASIWLMFVDTPISAYSGKPMAKYWNSAPFAAGEVLYICEDSKTFFRRTYTKKRKGI